MQGQIGIDEKYDIDEKRTIPSIGYPETENPNTGYDEANMTNTSQQLYRDVIDSLRLKEEVKYENAAKSFLCAFREFKSPETQEFLELVFDQITSIMLDQQAEKIAYAHKVYVQKTLMSAVKLCLLLLKKSIDSGAPYQQTLRTLASLFDVERNFYKGKRQNYEILQGAIEVQRNIFAESGGIVILTELVSVKPWMGCLNYSFVLSSLIACQVCNRTSEDDKHDIFRLCGVVCHRVMKLSDDELKKEGTIEMLHIVRHIGNLTTESNEYFSWWLNLALKYMKSQSLPQRLFGMEQLGPLRRRAKRDWHGPPRCVVIGAGVHDVNGIYTRNGTFSNVPMYTKRSKVTDTLYTLFRCRVPDGNCYWYLSIADLEKPGTEKDIDYYTVNSPENVPPEEGWHLARSSTGGRGKAPPPMIRPLPDIIDPQTHRKKSPEESSRAEILIQWANSNNVISLLFGQNLHREMITRSRGLLKFLVDTGALQSSHLELIWRSLIGKLDSDPQTAESLQTLLANTAKHLPPKLFVHFLQMLRKAVASNYDDVVALTGYICKQNTKLLFSKGAAAVAALLQLLWELQENSQSFAKSSNPDVIRVFDEGLRLKEGKSFRNYFTEKCIAVVKRSRDSSRMNGSNHHGDSVAPNNGNNVVNERDVIRAVGLLCFIVLTHEDEIEYEVTKLANTTPLLDILFEELCAFHKRPPPPATPIRNSRSSRSWERSSHRRKTDNKLSNGHSGNVQLWASGKLTNANSIKQRLELLRFMYGNSRGMELSFARVKILWDTLSSSEERKIYLDWLTSVCIDDNSGNTDDNENNVCTVFTSVTRQKIFSDLLSNKPILKSSLRDTAAVWRCFCVYFLAINHERNAIVMSRQPAQIKNTTNLSRLSNEPKNILSHLGKILEVDQLDSIVGLDALWYLVLNSKHSSCPTGAKLLTKDIVTDSNVDVGGNDKKPDYSPTNVLLSIYEKLKTTNNAAQQRFLKRVIEQLEPTEPARALRGLKLLQGYVSGGIINGIANRRIDGNDDDDDDGVNNILNSNASIVVTRSHGLRGRGKDLQILVHGRRIRPIPKHQYPNSTRGNSSEKLKPFELDLHGHESVLSLRRKIAVRTNHNIDFVRVMFDGRHLGLENALLGPLGLKNGDEVVAVLLNETKIDVSISQTNTSPKLSDLVDLSCDSISDSEAKVSKEMDINNTRGDDYFDKIFRLADKCKNDSVIHGAWELLKTLPTNITLERNILNAMQRLANDTDETLNGVSTECGDVNWDKLTGGESYHGTMYALQIVDFLLMPAEGTTEQVKRASELRQAFIKSGGFSYVYSFFLKLSKEQLQNSDSSGGVGVVIKIIKFCLFGNSINSYRDSFAVENISPSHSNSSTGSTHLLDGLDCESLLSKLVSVVSIEHKRSQSLKELKNNVTNGDNDNDVGFDCGVMIDAIMTMRCVIGHSSDNSNKNQTKKDEAALETLPSVSGVHVLVIDVLIYNENLNVRSLVADTLKDACSRSTRCFHFVFENLTSELQHLDMLCPTSAEFFSLLQHLGGKSSLADSEPLAATLCERLISFPRDADVPSSTSVAITIAPRSHLMSPSLPMLSSSLPGRVSTSTSDSEGSDHVNELDEENRCVVPFLVGALQILRSLCLRQSGVVSVSFAKFLFEEFLFSVPSPTNKSYWPVCRTPQTRRAAFQLLGTLQKSSVEILTVTSSLALELVNNVAKSLNDTWDFVPCTELRGSHLFSGLHNQGCTCYINSLVQLLFMTKAFSRGIMKSCSSIPHQNVSTLSEYDGLCSGADLVGRRVLILWESGHKYYASVERYIPYASGKPGGNHYIQYDDGNLSLYDMSIGRSGFETSTFHVLPKCIDEEDGGALFMRQVQRTFHFLSDSVLTAFDPVDLVESCKILNLNYNVHQQNDAAEFLDKVLGAIDDHLKKKGKPKNSSIPRNHVYDCFAVSLVKQKIPHGCPKAHIVEREEIYLRLEMDIRDKSSLEDALMAYTMGEEMTGDNKVLCDMYKKNVTLRSAFGKLPNTLLVHLKRFDLDFTTFEPVKLNNRIDFPVRLNMKPYTKEGIAEREAPQSSPTSPVGSDTSKGDCENDSLNDVNDLLDYEYELSGVLIHSGVAQGGHYYSFIKDKERSERTVVSLPCGSSNDTGDSNDNIYWDEGIWFRFDDDRVSPFDAKDIDLECFGGVSTRKIRELDGGKYVDRVIQLPRTSNALIIFYDKILPTPPTEEDTVEENRPRSDSAKSPCNKTQKSSLEKKMANTKLHNESLKSRTLIPNGSVISDKPEPVDYFLKEVWENNQMLIRNAYVLSPDFHSLLFSMLNAPNELIYDSTKSIEKPDVNKPPPLPSNINNNNFSKLTISTETLKNDKVNTGKEICNDTEFLLVKLGTMFFLDTLLHAANKVDMCNNLPSLIRLYERNPACCRWLLEKLISCESSEDSALSCSSCLRKILIECSSKESRIVILRLIVVAVRTLSSVPEEVVILQKATDEAMQRYSTLPSDEMKGESVNIATSMQLENIWDPLLTGVCTDCPRSDQGSIILRFLSHLMSHLEVVAKFWRHMDTYFDLLYQLAQISPIRKYLFVQDVVAVLINFFMQGNSPVASIFPALPQMGPRSSSSDTQVVHNQDQQQAGLRPDFKTLLEAISQLANSSVKPVQKKLLRESNPVIHLSEDIKSIAALSADGWNMPEVTPQTPPQLSILATKALSAIFENHSASSLMSASQMFGYFCSCGVIFPGGDDELSDAYVSQGSSLRFASGKGPIEKIHSIFRKYDTISETSNFDDFVMKEETSNAETDDISTFLTLSGFLHWYTDVAILSKDAVWRDLSFIGYRKDFTLSPDTLLDSPTKAPPPQVGDSTRKYNSDTDISCPPLSKLSLSMKSNEFYRTAIATDPAAATGLLVRLCKSCSKRQEESIAVVQLLMGSLFAVSPGWRGKATAAPLVAALRAVLAIEDDTQIDRIKEAFVGEDALFEVSRSRSLECERFGNNTHMLQATYNLVKTTLLLMQVHAVDAWLRQPSVLSQWSWMAEWLRISSLEAALGGSRHSLYRRESKMKVLKMLWEIHGTSADGLQCKVEGAGVEDVNGLYVGDGFFDTVPKYTRKSSETNTLYTLFRCTVPNNTKWWYISITDELKPGTDKDIDYYALCSNSETPPENGWNPTTRPPSGMGKHPPPIIKHLPRISSNDTTNDTTNDATKDVNSRPEDGNLPINTKWI